MSTEWRQTIVNFNSDHVFFSSRRNNFYISSVSRLFFTINDIRDVELVCTITILLSLYFQFRFTFHLIDILVRKKDNSSAVEDYILII